MANTNFSSEYSPWGRTEVVDAIYDCAIVSSRWHDVIHMLAESCASPFSFFATHDYATQRSNMMFALGYMDKFISSYQSDYAILDPLFEPIRAAPPGVVETRSMLIDEQDYYSSQFYREWAKPQGLGDCILVKVLQTEEGLTWWGAHRHEVAPRYQERDIGILAGLAPDLCRAVKICAAFKMLDLRINALEVSIDALASSVYLADRNHRVTYMNSSAERQIKASRGVRIERGRLTFIDRAARAAFEEALSKMMTVSGGAGAAPRSFAVPDGTKLGLVATVLPLGGGGRECLCRPAEAVAAIFVQDPLVGVTLPSEAFAKLYGLTDCERRVLLCLASAQCIKEIAVALGVCEPTVKTHLSHIFAKTGSSKQGELLQLFTSYAPPLDLTMKPGVRPA